jgi:hypothetical protein
MAPTVFSFDFPSATYAETPADRTGYTTTWWETYFRNSFGVNATIDSAIEDIGLVQKPGWFLHKSCEIPV